MGIAFHPAEVIQDRNEHDLTKDFEDEISGYLYNSNIKKILENCHLHAGSEFLFENLKVCYVALVDAGIFPNDELTLVDSWISDCRQAMKLSKI
jgi:hypothetical protein